MYYYTVDGNKKKYSSRSIMLAYETIRLSEPGTGRIYSGTGRLMFTVKEDALFINEAYHPVKPKAIRRRPGQRGAPPLKLW